jgi:hypothetical protein
MPHQPDRNADPDVVIYLSAAPDPEPGFAITLEVKILHIFSFFQNLSLLNQCWGSVCFWASRICIRIRILPSSSKNSKKNLDFFCFVTSLWLFNSVPQDPYVFGSASGSVSQRYPGTDPKIWIRTKLSRIPKTVFNLLGNISKFVYVLNETYHTNVETKSIRKSQGSESV